MATATANQLVSSGGDSTTGKNQVLNDKTYQEVEYLKKNLGPILIAALSDICIRRPADPIEFLGHWLLRWRYNEELKRRDVQNALEVVRQKTWKEDDTEVTRANQSFNQGFTPETPFSPPGYGGPLDGSLLEPPTGEGEGTEAEKRASRISEIEKRASQASRGSIKRLSGEEVVKRPSGEEAQRELSGEQFEEETFAPPSEVDAGGDDAERRRSSQRSTGARLSRGSRGPSEGEEGMPTPEAPASPQPESEMNIEPPEDV